MLPLISKIHIDIILHSITAFLSSMLRSLNKFLQNRPIFVNYIISSHISYLSYRYYMFLREFLNSGKYIVMFIVLNHFNSLLSWQDATWSRVLSWHVSVYNQNQPNQTRGKFPVHFQVSSPIASILLTTCAVLHMDVVGSWSMDAVPEIIISLYSCWDFDPSKKYKTNDHPCWCVFK